MPHGIAAAVHLPKPSDEIADSILHRLHADEREHAAQLKGRRRIEWIGGRLAARVAARQMGVDIPALLPDPYGAPRAPKHLTVSIAHKEGLAFALIARKAHGAVGIDFEVTGRDRSAIGPKVLNAFEQAEVDSLAPNRQWTAILLRFAIKEALYKALAPRMKRYIGFQEVQISELANGSAQVKLELREGDPPSHAEVKYEWIPAGLVTTARVRWD